MKQHTPLESQEFEGQHDGEQVLFVFRRHIIAMRKGFYALLVPLLITAVPPLIWQDKLELFLLPIGGLLLGLILFSYYFIIWYFTIFIVTTERIRQVTRRSLFGKDVVELRLEKIQNISYTIPGLIGELFRFGTIVIQTFVGDLVIHNVEHPTKTYNKLQDAVHNATKDRVQQPHEEINQ
ncbi:MAG: PH domain-containing protein [Candidatus Saccharimonas sp.]